MLRSTTSRVRRATRSGFTLVELLVMAAVSVIIMAVLANVFSTGIDAIRQIRSQGDMMDQTRSAGEVIKRDLRNQSFLADPISGGVGDRTRLSHYRSNDPIPRGGFFKIFSQNYVFEGTDSDQLQSYRATDHVLQFTSIASGNVDANYYSATLANSNIVVTSPAAEIAYFLVADTGRFTGGNGSYGPQQMFKLIRRQKLLAVNDVEVQRINGLVATAPVDPTAGDVISMNGNVNKLTDLVTNNRMGLTQLGAPRIGDDVLLSNVLSFEVKTLLNTPTPFAGGNADTDHPFGYYGGTFDTGANAKIPAQVRSLQLRIRIYDLKLQQARQMTFILDM